MIVYFLAFILTFIFVMLYKKVNICLMSKKRFSFFWSKILDFLFLLLSIFPLWFISAFRYNVGTDYLNTYVRYYEETKLGWKPYSEFLFQWLNEFLVEKELSVVWLFAITSFVFLLFTFKTIYNYSTNVYISVFILFISGMFFNSLNNVRQYMALAISVYGYFHKNKFYGMLLIAISLFIHFSCILIIPLFIMKYVRKIEHTKKIDFFIISILLLTLSPFLCKIIKYILEVSKYNYFINIENAGFSLLFFIVNATLLLIMMLVYDNKDKSFVNFAYIQLLSFILCVCAFLMPNEEFWMRVIRITAFFQIIFVPDIVSRSLKFKTGCISTILIYSTYLVYTVYTMVIMGGNEILPYRFIF